MKKLDYIGIPQTAHCAFAINLDTSREEENIIIGELSEVKKYLSGYKNADILVNERRSFGAFILDCSHPIPETIADIRVVLADNTGKRKTPAFETAVSLLEELWFSNNLVHKFAALRIWQEYTLACKIKGHDIYSAIEAIALPLNLRLQDNIHKWQDADPSDPLHELESEFFEHPAFVLYKHERQLHEYYTSDFSLLPLVVYYLKTVYQTKTYFQTCRICGRIFRASSAKSSSLCSTACRREQNKINKQEFDSRAKEKPCELEYKKQYMFWYNRIKKLRKSDIAPQQLAKAEKAFEAFRTEAVKKKKAALSGKLPEKEFIDWMFKKGMEFEDMVDCF